MRPRLIPVLICLALLAVIAPPTAAEETNITTHSYLPGYTTHWVRFMFTDLYGNPITELPVNASIVDSTSPLSWITDLLGFPADSSPDTVVLEGVTGSDGSWLALMVQNARYQIHVDDPSRSIQVSFTLYPKDTEYSYVLFIRDMRRLQDEVFWELSQVQLNASAVELRMHYNDTSMATTSLIFQVRNTTREIVHQHEYNDLGTVNASFTVENIKGDEYTWGFVAEHATFPGFGDTAGITLLGPSDKLVDLGDEVFELWVSILLLGLVAAFYSIQINYLGAVVLPSLALVFWGIGWLRNWIPLEIVFMALVFGALLYITNREVRAGT